MQTVCQYCKSILVRTDVDLKKVGQVADLPPDSSPIQLNTEGIYRNKAFVVIGRILYEYDQGGWNEWHIMMNDGSSAWLSDAQNEFAISFASFAPALLLALWIYRVTRSATHLPMGMNAGRVGGVLFLTLAMSAASGWLALRKLRAANTTLGIISATLSV